MTEPLDYDKLDQLYRRTKGKLLFSKEAGFLGPMICHLDFQWDESIPTACVNGVMIKWNPHWFLTLSESMRVTVLAHEAWHVGFMHMVRVEDRDPQLWNIAGDYVINNKLHRDGYIFEGDHLYDPQYDGMTTEQVYALLEQQFPKGTLPPTCSLSGGSSDIDSSGDGPTKAEIIHTVMSAQTTAIMAGVNPGNIPGEITKTISDFLRPVLPWEILLQNYFNELVDTDRSFQRPNRRYQDPDPLMPGNMGTDGLEHLIYFLDVSGSISDKEVVRFNSEVKYIKDTFNPDKLSLVLFDTKIRDVFIFEKDDPFEKVVVTGRGGTDLRNVVEYANKQKPTAVVIFTDLEVSIPSTKIEAPTLWVCVNNPKKTVPYGKIIYLNE